jgi:hypothetical protein
MGRYVVAAIVAVSLSVAGAIFVRVTSAYGASLGMRPGAVIELPSSTIWLIWLTDMMISFWWFLIPLLFVVCFGVARKFGRARAGAVK